MFLMHTLVQVCTLHDRGKQGLDQKILIGNGFHIKLHMLSPYSNKLRYHHMVFWWYLKWFVLNITASANFL